MYARRRGPGDLVASVGGPLLACFLASFLLLSPAVSLVAGTPARAADLPARPGAAVGGSALDGRGTVVDRTGDVPKAPRVDASSFVIADADTGHVLAAKDPHGRYRPASTIKILTALTLIPRLDPDDKVEPTRKDCAVEGSKVGLKPGAKYRVDDLFRGLLMASGNDAALALARAAGGLDRTLALMNATAQRLGAHDTVARTPHGLDRKGQRSSAYDLALLARHGLEVPEFRDYVTTVRADFPAPKKKGKNSYQIQNHNRLLLPGAEHYRGTVGVKNGWTSKAKASFVGAAERGDRTIIVALMHSEPYFWKDARKLLDWGFDARGQVRPVGTLVDPAPTAESTAEPPPTSPGTSPETSPETSPPTQTPPPAAAPPTAAAPAPGGDDPETSGDPPISPVAAGVAVGLAAAVLVGSGAAGLSLLRRRRAPGP